MRGVSRMATSAASPSPGPLPRADLSRQAGEVIRSALFELISLYGQIFFGLTPSLKVFGSADVNSRTDGLNCEHSPY